MDEVAFAEGKSRFTNALDNDLNTSLAVTALYDALKLKTNDATKLALIADFDKVLSLDLIAKADEKRRAAEEEKAKANEGIDPALVADIEAQIALRAEAKKNKNYAEADRIRNELLARGITLIDTPAGTQFKIG